MTDYKNLQRSWRIVDYETAHGLPLIKMWRESFERAVGVVDPHTYEEQLSYFNEKVLTENTVSVVLNVDDNEIIGFLASNAEMINQLYVHVHHQRRGIGTALLQLALERASGTLRLFTFQRNTGAQQFYERHGFQIIHRGFEESWQLEDIEYEIVVR